MTSPIAFQVVKHPNLPGVPTPKGLDQQKDKTILPGVPTPFFHEAVTQEIVAKGLEFYSLLMTLDRCLHPPERVKGLMGGPGLVHPNSCKSGLEEAQAYFIGRASNNSKDQKVLERLQEVANAFVPIYNEYIQMGIHYPSAENPKLRYVDSKGQEISKGQFDEISRQYEEALAEALVIFKK